MIEAFFWWTGLVFWVAVAALGGAVLFAVAMDEAERLLVHRLKKAGSLARVMVFLLTHQLTREGRELRSATDEAVERRREAIRGELSEEAGR